MAVIQIGDTEYRTEKLDIREQLHVARRLHPLVGAFRDALMRGSTILFKAFEEPKGDDEQDKVKVMSLNDLVQEIDAIEPFTTALGRMEDADADFIMKTCLSKVYKAQYNTATGEVTGWNSIIDKPSGQLMFQDITLDIALQLVWSVASESLGNFTSVSRLFRQTG